MDNHCILSKRNKTEGKDHVNNLVFAYNYTNNSTTGLPIDLILPTEAAETRNNPAYIEKS